MTTVGVMTRRPLDRDHLNTVLTGACAAVGLDPAGAELIKFTNNAVFRLPTAGAVVRIAGSPAIEGRVQKVIQVAAWLAAHNMPTVRLLDGFDQPLEVEGYLATLWDLVPSVGPTPNGTDIGSLLRRWHKLSGTQIDLPKWQPLNSIRERLDQSNPLEIDEQEFLRRRADEIEADLAEVRFILPEGPIWGDAFLGNLISGPAGPVACDFDGAAFGPREWDLTPIAVGAVRFEYPKNNQDLLAAEYGFNVMEWEGFSVLRQVRELQLVTSVLPVLSSNPGLLKQWRHRFDSLRTSSTARWMPYA